MVRILLELADSYPEWTGNRCRIRLALSHQDLANLIGVSRETATITLGQLQTEGLIEIQREVIQPNLEAAVLGIKTAAEVMQAAEAKANEFLAKQP